MANQKARQILASDGVTKDDLLVVYGGMLDSIVAQFVYRSLLNTNYENEPVKGGTVLIKRLALPTVRDYGTARTNGTGDVLKNKGITILVDKDKEIAEEETAKDRALYEEGGELAVLNSRKTEFVKAMGIHLEGAYFVKLQMTAQANGLVNVSGGSDIADKLSLLIEALEAKVGDTFNFVDRENMVLTLGAKWYDALEKHTYTLPNPIEGGQNPRFFRRVQVLPAPRQGYDAIIQVKGAIAQPMVLGNFKMGEIDLSDDMFVYQSVFYGTEAVQPELVLACMLDSDISV